MKVVIDTNVIISAMYFGGHPKELLDLLLNHEFDAYASFDIILEYAVSITNFESEYPEKSATFTLPQLADKINVINPTSKIRICRDPDDDKFIECAVDANCIYIISGDKDLLSVREYKDITILTVNKFLEQFKK